MSEFIAEASVLIRPDTTKFRAMLEAELVAATKGITVPIPVVAAAAGVGAGTKAAKAETAALAVEKQGLAAATTAASAAAVAETAALEGAAAAAKTNAAAVAGAAVAQEQLHRGFLATLLSMLGIRGATLAASTQFLIGAATITILAKAVQGASKDAEALAKVSRVLGTELGDQLDKSARQLSLTLGIADDEILAFQGSVGQMFRTVGVGNQDIVAFTSRLTQLAADLAAFANVSPQIALNALRSAIAGNVRGLRVFGLTLNNTVVQQKAMAETGKDTVSALTQQELVLARYHIILQQTANLQGTFAQRAQGLAGQSKILAAQIDQLGDSIGKFLIPRLTQIVTTGNRVVGTLTEISRRVHDLTGQLNDTGATAQRNQSGWDRFSDTLDSIFNKSLMDQVGRFNEMTNQIGVALGIPESALNRMARGTDAWNRAMAEANSFFTAFFNNIVSSPAGFFALGKAMDTAASSADNFSRAIRQIDADVSGLESQLLDLEFSGAPASAQRAILEKELARQNEKIQRLAGASFSKDPKEAAKARGQIEKAKRERNAIQDRIDALDAQEASKASAAASAAQSASDKAKTAAEEAKRAHDQAIQDQIAENSDLHTLAMTKAEGTKTLQDDIKAQEAYRKALILEINSLAKQILDVKLRNQVIRQLEIELASTTNAINQLKEQQAAEAKARKEAQREREKTLRDQRVASLELDVQFNQTKENVKGEIKARQALVKYLVYLRDHVLKRGTNAWKQIRNRIAEEQQAIKELKKQVDKRNDAAKELGFAFLQAQSGFAANLLSNILPAGTLTGTVGGGPGGFGGPATGTSILPPPPRPPEGAPRVGGGLSMAAQTAAPRTVTQGQMSVLIELTRQIVRILGRQSGQAQHPEAHNQRRRGSASMDIM